jgi:hypothetical protein
MRLYRFSPIKNKREFEQALQYVAEQLELLSKKLAGEALPIESLKIFAHYPEEYPVLKKILLTYGQPVSESATSLYVEGALQVGGNEITAIGIRVADPYRFQVGCGDFTIANAAAFRAQHLDMTNGFVRDMPDREDQFIELWHPDFDVAGYIKK